MVVALRGAHYILLSVGLVSWLSGHPWFAVLVLGYVLLGLYLISIQPTTASILKGHDLTGQVAIITGSTAGIGLATARALARANAHVIVCARSETKAAEALSSIRSTDPKASVRSLLLDLGDSRSIAEFARQFNELNLPLNLLILNAGSVGGAECTSDGMETTMGVTHFGHFALTQLLLPKLLAHTEPGAPASASGSRIPRVVVVSSHAHMNGSTCNHEQLLRWATIEKKDRPKWGATQLYEQAKLANVLFARELDRKYQGRILTSALHPGSMVQTDIARNHLGFSIAFVIFSAVTKSLDQGAGTSVFCAVDKSIKGGGYYADCAEFKLMTGFMAKMQPGQVLGFSEPMADALWRDSLLRFKELFPGSA